MPQRALLRAAAIQAIEVLAAVALASGGVAALQNTAPPAGLGVLYLLAVLAIAVRRGERAALVTALVSVLTLNYFFITPRHRLTISHSQDVAELGVFLIAAVVVGRLAATGRQRAAEAESRARLAAAREREAALLAEAASAILAGQNVESQLHSIGSRVAAATGAMRVRAVLEPVPSPAPDELAVPLPLRDRAAWLYVSKDATWERADIERISKPLGRLIDVALERDRVAERAAETEAGRRAETARTAILHSISHDLRSPLTAITTAGAALEAAGVTDAERAELTEAIQVEGARLARMVDDLLDLSRIQAGAVQPRTDWCDLHEAVVNAIGQARAVEGEHPIAYELPPDLPLVKADPAQLERVFANLIQNAIRYSPPDVPVRVTGGIGAGYVTVRVIDRGRGIPPSQRANIFEPFFRGRESGGSGLGLAISRGFVEANGGRIQMQTGTTEGTSFAVSFPLVPQPVTAT
jgi:two-component system sensor histidine kinase KdpD